MASKPIDGTTQRQGLNFFFVTDDMRFSILLRKMEVEEHLTVIVSHYYCH